ncbi:hypothetical protein D3C78_1010820 [compost metagenome]
MKLECVHADTCLSEYWSGHHLPHVQIPVWNGMSLKEIKAAIKDELRQGYVMGNGDDARLLSDDFVGPTDEERADKLTKAAYAAVNRMKPAKKGQRKFFTELDKVGDDEWDTVETIYAFFVFVEIE